MPDAAPVVAVAGEVIIDLVPAGGDGLFRAAPGGSPANVAVGLTRLGVSTRLLARLSDDAMGRRLRQHLETNGLALDHVIPAGEPTSMAILSVDADGLADYDFRVDGTADWQWSDEELSGATDDSVAALHVGSLAMTMEPGASALRRLVERVSGDVTITLDPNVRPALMGRRDVAVSRIEALVGLADVVKASVEDLAWLCPDEPPEAVAQRWLAAGPALVVVTLGPEGSLAVGAAAGTVRRPAIRVSVVDTVGAGDAFMAALIAGLARRDLVSAPHRADLAALGRGPLADVLDEAALAAALTCARPGADPPTVEELRRAQLAPG
jgi:fructokinase